MLWEKGSDSIYVDLLKNVVHLKNPSRLNRKKSNKLSIEFRIKGNDKFKENEFEGAMHNYNQSVCFAEYDCEDLGLAYANRSMCFLKLKMYDRCLIDIELAKVAKYPKSLMWKLDERKSKCMTIVPSEMRNKPTLSFDADEKLPCMANVVQIDHNEQYGRLFVAKRDIQIGETVIVEEAYVRTVNEDENSGCTNCGKKKMNFVPCKNCSDVMYCSEECADNEFHETECDMVIGTKEDICDGESLSFILRSVVTGINTFETINEMIEFVEKCGSANSHEITECCDSPKSKYRTFFKLASLVSHQLVLDYRNKAYFIFHAIIGSSKLAYKFGTTNAKRFLIHLIIHHGLILRTNSFSFREDKSHVHELFLLNSYFNHSCLRNITKLSKGNLAVSKAILPIKRGEQLYVTYIGDEVFSITEQQRNDQLESTYGFRCKCKLCTNGTLYAGDLEKDPNFMYIVRNAIKVNDNFDIHIVRKLIQRCIEFLLQHVDMIGSEEVAYISNTLAGLFSKELNV